ncbi:MAG: glycosyltransferase family 4 protein [Thermococci archaeon]|nr:glycosyltransferase family 4 protein [Thermococci archaeon]
METLKIALASDWYYPKVGGVAVHMHDLAINLRRLGHEVDIVTNSGTTGKEEELKNEGIGLVKIPGLVFKDSWVNGTVIAKNASYLIPFARKYDVIHGQHAFTPLALKFVAAGRKVGAATLLTTHSINFENSPLLRLLSRITYPYYKYQLSNPHRIIAVSRAAKTFIKRFTKVPVEVIPNGVNTGLFHDGWDKEGLKDELGLDGEVILYVGRIDPRKGLNVLIEAMRNVEGTLVVAGAGKNLGKMVRTAELLGVRNRVRFLGHVSYDKLPRLYGASDVFVLPSVSEAFGIVLLEAMASGVPVIGTRVGGIPEIIDGCGLLVPPNDSSALADAINSIINNQHLAAKLGRLGKSKVDRVYSWKKVVERIVSIYVDVLDGRTGGEVEPRSGPHVRR